MVAVTIFAVQVHYFIWKDNDLHSHNSLLLGDATNIMYTRTPFAIIVLRLLCFSLMLLYKTNRNYCHYDDDKNE